VALNERRHQKPALWRRSHSRRALGEPPPPRQGAIRSTSTLRRIQHPVGGNRTSATRALRTIYDLPRRCGPRVSFHRPRPLSDREMMMHSWPPRSTKVTPGFDFGPHGAGRKFARRISARASVVLMVSSHSWPGCRSVTAGAIHRCHDDELVRPMSEASKLEAKSLSMTPRRTHQAAVFPLHRDSAAAAGITTTPAFTGARWLFLRESSPDRARRHHAAELARRISRTSHCGFPPNTRGMLAVVRTRRPACWVREVPHRCGPPPPW